MQHASVAEYQCTDLVTRQGPESPTAKASNSDVWTDRSSPIGFKVCAA